MRFYFLKRLSYFNPGAFMFIHTQQWDFLNSIYFCFVTLSTIGFGDFVPKNKNNQDIGLTEDQTELVRVTVNGLR